MFGFRRKDKKKEVSTDTADTFVEATGGGWIDLPETVADDGGSQADYVGKMLERARAHSEKHNIGVGECFTFTITDIPRGIVSPDEIMFGLIMRATDFGLAADAMINEKITFTRLK